MVFLKFMIIPGFENPGAFTFNLIFTAVANYFISVSYHSKKTKLKMNRKPDPINRTHDHCCSCMSRRRCVGLLSTAALGLATGTYGISTGMPSSRKLQRSSPDYIDVTKLRPKPGVKVVYAVLEQPRPYWLGWPGTTYELDARQKEFRAKLDDSCRRLGVEAECVPAPVNDEPGMAALVNRVKSDKPDGLVIILQHMQCWKWIDPVVNDLGVPLIVFAPVGTAFVGHVGISRMPGVYVVSSMEWEPVEEGLRMIKARRMYEETRVLHIRGNLTGETVMDKLGMKVKAIPRDTFNELYNIMPVTEEVKDVAYTMRRRAMKIVEPTEEDILNAARVYTTAKRLMTDHQANALSMDCLGMVTQKLIPTPPCGAWSRLQDEGITAGCEADLMGAAPLMLSSYLLNRPGFMNDPVPETYKNLLIAAHCVSGTRLGGFDKPQAPYILRDHSESSLGVSVQVLWPVGETVTLIDYNNPGEIIVDTGKVVGNVDTPPAGGCRTSVEISMDSVEDPRDVQGFHQVVVLGDHRRIIESFSQLYGIRVVHSRAKAEHATI